MNPHFPAFQLLLVLSAAMLIGLPLLIWLFMRGHRDGGARLWFLAVAFHVLAVFLVGYLGRFHWLSAVLFLWALALGIESMRWELGRPPAHRVLALLALLGYAALQFTLDQLGLRMTWGYTVNLSLLVAGEGTLMVLLLRAARLHHSRGLRMVALGIGLIGAINAVRLVIVLIEGRGPEAFDGVPSTNVAIVVVTLFTALQVVGYGGFVMEKLHRRQLDIQAAEALAKAQRLSAEIHAREMEALVRQRDDMIMLNSRFSSVTSMTLYNSAIVHEISQPLQALLSILDGMSLRTSASGQGPDGGIDHAIAMVQKMSGTLTALRALMGSQQPGLENLKIDAVLHEILPIMQTQARRQGVLLEHRSALRPEDQVCVNPILLQRVIFNLVTNAFEAMAAKKSLRPSQTSAADAVGSDAHRLRLSTFTETLDGHDWCVLRVEDSGPGLPDNLKLEPGLLLHSSKERGLGVGLSFTTMLVESWRGELIARNRAEGEGGGAVVEVRLPRVGIGSSACV